MTKTLKIDATMAAQTYKFMIPDNKSYRLEGASGPVGMTEMIRLLFEINDPRKKPWETLVDPAFLPGSK